MGEASNPGPPSPRLEAEARALVGGPSVPGGFEGHAGSDVETESGEVHWASIARQLRSADDALARAHDNGNAWSPQSDSNATDVPFAVASDVIERSLRTGAPWVWDDASVIEGSISGSESGQRSEADASSSATTASSTSRGRRKRAKDRFGLTIANATGWGKLKDLMSSSQADFFVGVETWVTPDLLDQESDWCKRAGRKALMEPALGTEAGGRSAGLLVAVKPWVGMGYAPGFSSVTLVPNRLMVVHVNAMVKGGMIIYAVYLHDAEGLTNRNIDILNTLGEHAASHGRPWMAAGDWNMEPAVLQSWPAFRSLRGTVISAGAPTCFAGKGGQAKAEYDYMVVDSRIAAFVNHPFVDEGAITRPHRPVTYQVTGGIHKHSGAYLVLPKPFPLAKPVGPSPPPGREWLGYMTDCWSLEDEHVHSSAVSDPSIMLQPLWERFCTMAEDELCDIHGYDGMQRQMHCGRGRAPRIAKKPSLGWKGHLRYAATTPRGLQLRWLEVRLSEAAALSRGLRSVGNVDGSSWWRRARQRSDILQKNIDRLDDSIIAVLGAPWIDRIRKLRNACMYVSTDAPDYEYITTIGSLDAWATDASVHAQAEEAAARNHRASSWRRFAREATAGSARQGHKWYKCPVKWEPEAVQLQDDDGDLMISYADADVGADCLRYWNTIWGTEVGDTWHRPQPGDHTFDELARLAREHPLRRVSVDELRRLCQSFSEHTATGFDGWHPRQWAQLSDEALHGLLALLQVIESLHDWPEATKHIRFARIPKKGGHRLIGILTGLYRLWGKMRRPESAGWEEEHHRAWDYAAAGRGAAMGAWDIALEIEASESLGMSMAAFLADMEKFYEYIPHGLVAQKALKLGFPPAVALLAVRQYGSERRIAVNGCLTEGVLTDRGVVAGCSIATSIVKLVLVEVIDDVKNKFPRLLLFNYLDDLTLLWRGFRLSQLQRLADAVEYLVTRLERTLDARVSRSKTVIVGSSSDIVRTLAVSLFQYGFQTEHEVRMLGFDMSLAPVSYKNDGKAQVTKRCRRRRPTRRARYAKVSGRMIRLLRLKRAGADSTKLWVTGQSPSLNFDAAVLGVPPGLLLSQRRSAGAACLPGGGGRSLTIGFLLHRRKFLDPIFAGGIAPIAEWSKQAWLRGERGTLGTMRLAWARGVAAVGNARLYWRRVNGPAAAMAASLKRIGWTSTSPFILHSDVGVKYDLLEYSPLRLLRRLREACVRWQCRQLTSVDLRSAGTDLDWQVVRSLLHDKRSPLDATARGALRSLIDGSAWDAFRCWQAGYLESSSCSCGEPIGNHHHLIWTCPHHAEERDARVPSPVREAGAAAAAGDPFWCRCFPLPLPPVVPRPWSPSMWTGPQLIFSGEAYIDGSRKDGDMPVLQAAGSAAIMLQRDGDGYSAVGIFAPLEGEDQLPGDAEVDALDRILQLAEPPLRVYTDYEALVRAYSKGEQWATHWRRVHADRWRSIFASLRDWPEGSFQLLKVKAHRTVQEREQLDDRGREIWWGNYLVDKWAKAAAEINRQPAEVRNRLQANRRLYVTVARWAAEVVRTEVAERPWQRMGRQWSPFVPLPGRSFPTFPRHNLVKGNGVWRCTSCTQWAATPFSVRRLRTLRCKGAMETRLARATSAQGMRPHALYKSEPLVGSAGPVLFWCAACGAYASEAPRDLVRNCPRVPLSRAGKQNISWLRRGWHPRRYIKYGEPSRLDVYDYAEPGAAGPSGGALPVPPPVEGSGAAPAMPAGPPRYQFDDPEGDDIEEDLSPEELFAISSVRGVASVRPGRRARFSLPSGDESVTVPLAEPLPQASSSDPQDDEQEWWKVLWASGQALG